MIAAALTALAIALACYEHVAVNTGKVPTITRLVQAIPFWPRLVLATVLPAYLWIDHIWLRGWGI
jgi:hypothetical protein